MAAATQVPAGTHISKTWCVELLALIAEAVALGIVTATSETVAVLQANLATERDAR